MALRPGFKIISATEAEYKGVKITCEAYWLKNTWGILEAQKCYKALDRTFKTLAELFAAVDKIKDN